MRTCPCSVKQSQFLWEEARSCFIACFLLQKNLWARALRLEVVYGQWASIWVILHLRNWAGGGGGLQWAWSLLDVEPLSHEPGRGDRGLRAPSGFVIKIEPLSQWEQIRRRRQPHLLAHSLRTVLNNTGVWGHDEKCWHPAPLGEQPTCWGQAEICVLGHASLEWGFCATGLGSGEEWVIKAQTITVTICTVVNL